MKSAKGRQEEEVEEDYEFGTRKDSSIPNCSNKDVKYSDKTNATRSKHSVTEQRRRSKINERFQILRQLIPHSDQKRDTASFLVEVIDHVQYLQEKVQKYEATSQGWSQEPTKLMPWRNSHWHTQSLVGHPQAIKNGSASDSIFSGRFDDEINSIMHRDPQNPVESDKATDQQIESVNKTLTAHLPLQEESVPAAPPPPMQGDQLLANIDTLNQHQDLMVEGGTISISNMYSEGLLKALTHALQSSGVDLSQANISVQIDLGKRANRGSTSGLSFDKDHENGDLSNQQGEHCKDMSNGVDADQAQKKLKI